MTAGIPLPLWGSMGYSVVRLEVAIDEPLQFLDLPRWRVESPGRIVEFPERRVEDPKRMVGLPEWRVGIPE